MTYEIVEIRREAKELQNRIDELNKKADEILEKEQKAPEWLKAMIVAIAKELGIPVSEFEERVKIVHPTPSDPVLVVDGKAMVAWI